MKKELIALLKKLGILKDEQVAGLETELDKINLDDPHSKIDPSKITDPALKQVVEALNNQITILANQNKTLLDTLNAERAEREKGVKLQQEAAKAAKDKSVADLLDEALKSGKIVEAKKEWLKKYAENDLASAQEWVKDAPVDKNFKPANDKDEKNKDKKNIEVPTKPYAQAKQEYMSAATEAFKSN